VSSADADIGIGNAFVEMKTIEDVRKKLQEINEHIKKEQNNPVLNNVLDVPKWVLKK